MNPNEDGDLEKRHLTSKKEISKLIAPLACLKALRDKKAAAAIKQDGEDKLVVAGDEEDAQLMQGISESNQKTIIKIEEIDETEEADGGDGTNGRDLIVTPKIKYGVVSDPDAGRFRSILRFRCQQPGCSSSFKNKRSLYQHLVAHTTLFQCRECRKCFQSRSELQRHQPVHSDDRPLKCQVQGCDKRFKVKGNLTKHMINVHLNVRKFRCDQKNCQKAFASRCDLGRHLKTHH